MTSFTPEELAELAAFDAEVDGQLAWDAKEIEAARERDNYARAQGRTTSHQRQLDAQKRYKQRNAEVIRQKRHEYYLRNRDRELAKSKAYRDSHKQHCHEHQIAYDDAHRTARREASNRWKREHPDQVKAYEAEHREHRLELKAEWVDRNRDHVNELRRKRYEARKNEINAKRREYLAQNREKINARRRAWYAQNKAKHQALSSGQTAGQQ